MKGRNTLLIPLNRCSATSLVFLVLLTSACSNSSDPKDPNLIPVSVSFGEVGLSPGQFSYPRCIDAGLGALWVVDKTARIQKLDPKTGAYLGGWRMPEFEFGKPTGITLAPGAGGETLVYVADTHYHRVRIYRPGDCYEGKKDPELLASIGSYGKGDGQLIFPTDIAVLMSPDNKSVERLYISEYGGNDRINIYTPAPPTPGQEPNSYVFSSSFGSFGSSATPDHIEFSRPQSLAIDAAARQLIVTDACNHRLGVYGSAGREKGHLASPWGVTILGDTVYALDSGNNRVLGFPARFDPPTRKPNTPNSNNSSSRKTKEGNGG